MARHSVVWIGAGEGLAARGLDTLATLDVTWTPARGEASELPRERFDLALLEDAAGTVETLQGLRADANCPPVLVMSDQLDAQRTRQLISAGADDVLLAPRGGDTEQLRDELTRRLARINRARRPRRVEATDAPPPGVIAHSRAFRGALALARRAARSSATVLLAGETGSGKEVIARAVHALGQRASGPFVAVNCAAFPDALLESELFGHLRGAFTGAEREKAGLFEEANGGTLFLDEIGETTGPLQAKLLRVLQEREIRPLGGTRVRRINARVVAASNRDLLHEAEAGRFRTDLYYRLAVFPIHVPPLRERAADVLALARHFLEVHSQREGLPGCQLSPSVEPLLLAHDWPGNVRELENEMLRALALADAGEAIGPEHLSARITSANRLEHQLLAERGATLRARVARFERILIREALARNAGKRTSTARELGITREGLHKKMKRLGVE